MFHQLIISVHRLSFSYPRFRMTGNGQQFRLRIKPEVIHSDHDWNGFHWFKSTVVSDFISSNLLDTALSNIHYHLVASVAINDGAKPEKGEGFKCTHDLPLEWKVVIIGGEKFVFTDDCQIIDTVDFVVNERFQPCKSFTFFVELEFLDRLFAKTKGVKFS